jgi:hypothetical protein
MTRILGFWVAAPRGERREVRAVRRGTVRCRWERGRLD